MIVNIELNFIADLWKVSFNLELIKLGISKWYDFIS